MKRDPFRYEAPTESPGYLMWRATNEWQRRQRAALARLGLTHVQFVVLAGIAWLARPDEPVTQTLVARHQGIDLMMTSQVTRSLEAKGFVRRVRTPEDKRALGLKLTSRGRTILERAVPVAEDVDEDYFAGLGPRRGPFMEGLRRLGVADFAASTPTRR